MLYLIEIISSKAEGQSNRPFFGRIERPGLGAVHRKQPCRLLAGSTLLGSFLRVVIL